MSAKSAKGAEKRKYPRLQDANISLKVKSEKTDVITKSLNISASGVYCKVEEEIPLMSRIKIILILPKAQAKESASPKNVKIETDGVVVREHPVIVNGKIEHYDVAIFFDNIPTRDRELIKEYIHMKSGERC